MSIARLECVSLRSCLETIVEGGHLRADAAELPRAATNGWLVPRYWIDFPIEARDIGRIEREHVEERVEQFAAFIRPI